MTRINVGIEPSELHTKMLVAEHREIKRIPNCIKMGRYNMIGIPDKFTLGIGHVKFFYDKLLYLKKRYEKIHAECVKRGFKMTYFGSCFEGLPIHLMNDYEETDRDRRIIQARIDSKTKR